MLLQTNAILCGALLWKIVDTIVINKSMWDYEILSLEIINSNPETFYGEIKLQRISRREVVISGIFDFKFDIHERDTNEVEVNIQRSSTGNEDNFQESPFSKKRQHILDLINTSYKDLGFMKSFQNCSNMPIFENKIKTPVLAATYILDKCNVCADLFPSYLPEGYYKISLRLYGNSNSELKAMTHVFTKVDL